MQANFLIGVLGHQPGYGQRGDAGAGSSVNDGAALFAQLSRQPNDVAIASGQVPLVQGRKGSETGVGRSHGAMGAQPHFLELDAERAGFHLA